MKLDSSCEENEKEEYFRIARLSYVERPWAPFLSGTRGLLSLGARDLWRRSPGLSSLYYRRSTSCVSFGLDCSQSYLTSPPTIPKSLTAVRS